MRTDPPLAGLYRQFVLDGYEIAAAEFARDPSSGNWLSLKVAMWAWQRAHSMTVEESDAAGRNLLVSFATHAKGDSNFNEP